MEKCLRLLEYYKQAFILLKDPNLQILQEQIKKFNPNKSEDFTLKVINFLDLISKIGLLKYAYKNVSPKSSPSLVKSLQIL